MSRVPNRQGIRPIQPSIPPPLAGGGLDGPPHGVLASPARARKLVEALRVYDAAATACRAQWTERRRLNDAVSTAGPDEAQAAQDAVVGFEAPGSPYDEAMRAFHDATDGLVELIRPQRALYVNGRLIAGVDDLGTERHHTLEHIALDVAPDEVLILDRPDASNRPIASVSLQASRPAAPGGGV